VKNLISIYVILSTAILANVSQATLVENYLDKNTESMFSWGDKSNLNGSNVSFGGYLNHRQCEGNNSDILLLSSYMTCFQENSTVLLPSKSMPFSVDFNVLELPTMWHSDCTYLAGEPLTRRVANNQIADFLLVIENYPTNYFGQNMQITQPGTQNSTLARTFNQRSFRYPFERLLEDITKGDGMWLQQDLFMPIARLAENRYLEKKPTNPTHKTAKRRPDRLPTQRRGQSYYPRARDEEQAGPKLVVSRITGSKNHLLTHGNGVPRVLISGALRYRFPEFYDNRGYYYKSAKYILGANKRNELPTLARGLYFNQQYIPNLRVGVESWSAFQARDSNSGKIYNINKSANVNIPSVTPVRSSANDWPTAATRILNGQAMLGKLALAG